MVQMVTVSEAVRSIYGAWRLARLDPGGMAWFDRSPEGAANSFSAAVLLLPFFIVLQGFQMAEDLDRLSPIHVLIVEALSYVISWTAFPVAMITITRILRRNERFYDFLVAYNWSSVINVAVYFPVVVLGGLGLWPAALSQGLVLVATAAVLVYQWYVIKTALNVSGGVAFSLVLTDLIISIVLSNATDQLLYA